MCKCSLPSYEYDDSDGVFNNSEEEHGQWRAEC